MSGTVKRDGRISLNGKALTRRTGLSFSTAITLEEWQAIGKEISVIVDASSWWLGDWIIYGQDEYPDRYRQAIAETGLDYQTLRNYAWVARRFCLSRRRDKLSLHHHMEVAKLPTEQQDHWLDLAERSGWSKTMLRRELKAAENAANEVSMSVVQVTIPTSRKEYWERAAQKSAKDLAAWMLHILDDAAKDQLEPPTPA